MSRYIDADLIEYEPMCRAQGNGMYEDCECAYRDQIDDIPTADVRENVKAEWIKEIKHYKDDEQEYDYYDIYCSACGEKPEKAWHLTNYCPNCGAQMMRGEA